MVIKMVLGKNKLECLVTGILVTMTLLSGFILSSIKVSADDFVVDEVNVTVPVACTLNSIVDTAHTATINNNTY